MLLPFFWGLRYPGTVRLAPTIPGKPTMAEIAERVEDNPKTAFEKSDWPLGAIGLVLLGTLIFLVIAPFVLIGAFPRAVSDVSRALTVEPPQPRLQADPSEDLAQFLRR